MRKEHEMKTLILYYSYGGNTRKSVSNDWLFSLFYDILLSH